MSKKFSRELLVGVLAVAPSLPAQLMAHKLRWSVWTLIQFEQNGFRYRKMRRLMRHYIRANHMQYLLKGIERDYDEDLT